MYFCFIAYAKAFDCVDHNKLENSEKDGLLSPWGSPGRNTRVRGHSLLSPWGSPGRNTRVGGRSLLLGVFLTQGLNPYLILFPELAGGFFTPSATWEDPWEV